MSDQKDRLLRSGDGSEVQTRCRRCGAENRGDPWYCPQCGKETTLTPHDGGTAGDSVPLTRYVICRVCFYEKPLGQPCGEPCV